MILNADCFEAMADLDNDSVDAIITDPPYGILKHKIETNVNIDEFFKESHRVLKDNGFIVYFGQQPTFTAWNTVALKYFNYKNEIIWYKRLGGSPMLDMHRVFENIMVCIKGNRKFNKIYRPYTDVKESLADCVESSTMTSTISNLTGILKNKLKLERINDALNGKRLYSGHDIRNDRQTVGSAIKKEDRFVSKALVALKGVQPQNLVSFLSHNRKGYDSTAKGGGVYNVKHPTVKPVELMKYLIELTTNDDDVVLDPFMGSGTTGVAAKQLNREFIGYEIDKAYFEIAKNRIDSALSNTQKSLL